MDAKVAAQMCFPFIEKCDNLPDEHAQWGKDHLRYMVETIMTMDCPDKGAKELRLAAFMSQILLTDSRVERERLLVAMIDEALAICKSTEKAMRWVGWLQACIAFGGGATLEDMKQINLKA